MIGHALHAGPRPDARADRDGWIAAGFAIGSACFLVGPFPGFVQLVGQGADSVVLFAGSVFFTVLALAPVNWGTALGALCFFVGAVLLLRGHARRAGAGVQPLQPEET